MEAITTLWSTSRCTLAKYGDSQVTTVVYDESMRASAKGANEQGLERASPVVAFIRSWAGR